MANDWKPSACILCECNCGLEVELGGEGGRHLVRLRGDRKHPSSQGYACEKAHRLDHYQHGRDRLTTPLRRREDGSFESISWDTAIREVAERLAALRDAYGGASIFYYGGGGQGNHLPGAYATATRKALGAVYRSSALAQEKTGEFWVCNRMFGGVTRSDFEHCDVALFLGKNPWHSHSIPRARVQLKQIARDPARTLIVIDPRRTETAELADIHLAVRPGTDALLLAAILGILVEEDLVDHEFIDTYTEGAAAVLEALRAVPIADSCRQAGLDEALVRKAARAIGNAKGLASFEDLGVQMNHASTLVSYLHHLLIALTGSFGKPGSHYVPTMLVPFATGASGKKSPVVSAPIISGLVPCNVIAEEILTDHPKRYRGMIVEAANPAHSLADSKRMREALSALDTLVVIDVAMSETAALADYVLPASSQFEKAEATFFNFEYPHNYFHLRPRLMTPPDGQVSPLPEAEIHARLVEALGAIGESDYAPFREAAARGPMAYAETVAAAVMADPRLASQAPVLLYRTMNLPDDVKEGAVLLGLALRFAMSNGAALARAGFEGTPLEAAVSLFEKIVETPSGIVFSVEDWSEARSRIAAPGGKFQLDLPDLIAAFREHLTAPVRPRDPDFPFVLTAGERRSFTANTIIRDPAWRMKDSEGALRMNPADAAALGVTTGDAVRVSTKGGIAVAIVAVSDTMQPGHIALPNGLGVRYPDDGTNGGSGIAPNELTSLEDRDPFAGTPWHKNVPARLERISAPGAS